MRRDLHKRARQLLRGLAASLPDKVGGVLTLLPGETADAALERAAKAGRSGAFLLVPAPMFDEAEWESAAVTQQAALVGAAGSRSGGY